jgi:hypothetical protein
MPRHPAHTAALNNALAEMTTPVPERRARTEAEFLKGYTPWRPGSHRGGDRRETRHDGWTPDRQRLFLCILRYRRSVTRAAQAVGMSRENAYQLRRRWAPFAAWWDRALARDACTVADLMLRQVIDGVDVPTLTRAGKLRWKRVRPVDPGLWLLSQLRVVAAVPGSGPGLAGSRRPDQVEGPEAWEASGLVAALVGRGRSEW